MSAANPTFYKNEGFGVFPYSPVEGSAPCEADPLISDNSMSTTTSSGEEISMADDELLPVVVFRQTSSIASSKRSTPRSIGSSRVSSPREGAFHIQSYFLNYRLQCVDVTEDVRSVAIASAKLHCLYNFAPLYFSTTPDGLLFDDLRNEYEVFLSSAAPSHAMSMRIGQLTERIKGVLQFESKKST